MAGEAAVLGAIVIVGGALNNVVGKVRAKPLGAYDYFVSLFNALIYCILYWSLMIQRTATGRISWQQFKFVLERRRPAVDRDARNLSAPLMVGGQQHSGTSSTISTLFHRLKQQMSSWGAWKYLIITGACDALGNILGFISQPYVPGAVFSLMTQCVVPFLMFASMILLHERYTLWQVTSVLIVASGAVTALLPELAPAEWGLSGGTCTSQDCARSSLGAQTLFFSILTGISTLPTAISFVYKEYLFKSYKQYSAEQASRQVHDRELHSAPHASELLSDAEQQQQQQQDPQQPPNQLRARGQSAEFSQTTATDNLGTDVFQASPESVQQPPEELDIFVVAALGSFAQLCFIPLALPLNIALGQSHGASMVNYVKDGLSCFSGRTPPSCVIFSQHCEEWGCCKYALPSYLAYISINLVFNTSILGMLRYGSAVFAFVCMKAVLPVSILLFAGFTWPLLDSADTGVSSSVLASLAVVVGGIVSFRMASIRKAKLVEEGRFDGGQPPCMWPLAARFWSSGNSSVSPTN